MLPTTRRLGAIAAGGKQALGNLARLIGGTEYAMTAVSRV